MKPRHLQTTDTRSKIGKSVTDSGWRRRAKDKKNDLHCAVGAWEEDFQTPAKQWKGRAMLWEEYSFALKYDR